MHQPFLVAGMLAMAVLASTMSVTPHGIGLVPAAVAQTALPPVPGNCVAPTLSAVIPADMGPPNSQANANCFAWQQFIALNWLADAATCAADPNAGPSAFGTPNDTSPVVWESFKEASEVFQKNARKPTGWCMQQQFPARLRAVLGPHKPEPTSARGYKSLSSISKAGANPTLSAFGEAGTNNAWLTAQNGNIALYEVRINQDEFNFINHNGLYDATRQAALVQNPGFNLPDGTANFSQYGSIGSIELKASWIELPDASLWPKFKTSKAWVVYPWAPNAPRLVTVGLTGLHIIHKTKNSPQFIWATFEHVNNAPSTTDISANKLLKWYTFYNANCNPGLDHYHCNQNAQPPGTPATSPYFPNTTNDPYQAPIQVVRENPISNNATDNVAGLNAWVWTNLIAPANPDSVFMNYQLVDVLWSNNPAQIGAGAQAPLPAGTPQPSAQTRIVANTTMETYFQSTKNCLSCHQNAPIASSGKSISGQGLRKQLAALPGDRIRALLAMDAEKPAAVLGATPASAPSFASDYSFLFFDAQTAVPAVKKSVAAKAAAREAR
jgi:hypothetical protein